MNSIIPAILAPDEETFHRRIDLVEKLVPIVQVDVLDNTLYPNASWFDPLVISSLDVGTDLELHLMVRNPQKYIRDCANIRRIKRIVWHIEATIDHSEALLLCQEYGFETGLAIAPKTPIEELEPFAEMVDEILVLGVEPGRSGQSLIPETVEKAKKISTLWPETALGFDGGVTAKTLPLLREAGVTRFCAASAIFDAPDPVAALKRLQDA